MKRITGILFAWALILLPTLALAITPITTRAIKGSPLTYGEMDANFTNLRSKVDTDLELRLATIESGKGSSALGYTTKASMDADLAHAAGVMAVVTNDATLTNNTYWIKLGASGTGSWQKSAISPFLPYYSSRQFATLAQAITAIGSINTSVLRVSTSLTVANGDIVPANISIIVDNGGLFVGTGTQSLTFNGPFDAGRNQVFSACGTISGLKDTLPEWWSNNTTPGTTDMTAAILAAHTAGTSVTFTTNKYKTTSNITFTKPLTFLPSSMLSVVSGVIVFQGDINAGWWQIVETFDDLVSNPRANTSVKFLRHKVRAEWLGALSVAKIENIKTIPDQTNNLYKALRAAGGNYIARGSDYANENTVSVLELGIGHYRVDGTFNIGSQNGAYYYRLNGGGIIGQGPASSFLVRTNLASTAYVLFMGFYTGELTVLRDIKITAYDPDATGSKYSSAATAMVFCQGDSLQINNIWVSGAQTATQDASGVWRNGVGIQFESCVDTFATDIFVELCSTNIAFSSSVVNLTNVTSYASLNYNIGMGNYSSAWPDSQSTTNSIRINNIEMKSIYNYGVHAMSRGQNSLFMNSVHASCFQENTGLKVGVDFIHIGPYAALNGGVNQARIEGFTRSLLNTDVGAGIGYESAFRLTDVTVSDVSGSIGSALIELGNTNVCNLFINNLSANSCIPQIFNTKGTVIAHNLFLKSYTGVADAGSNRQIFSQQSGYLEIRGIFRDAGDSQALNVLGWQGVGTAIVDAQPIPNATRSIIGTGTKLMTSNATFL